MIYIDIETIPDQTEGAKERAAEGVTPPGNYKRPEAIQEWWDTTGNKKKLEAWKDTALDGSHGEIVCIGWKTPRRPAKVLQRDHTRESEADMLREWISTVEDCDPLPPWIGHNVQFDLRFLWQRCVIHGLIMPFVIPRNAKPWAPQVYCTAYAWTGKEHGISLANLCRILKIPVSDDDVKGSEVWDAICAGRLDDVAEHCRRDVERVRLIHQRMSPSALPREDE